MAFAERRLTSWHPCLTSFTPTGLALYSDPSFWLYGLLPFCAKTCEAKTTEVGGVPALRAKDEKTTPVLESNRNALSLMQTVMMSFGRNHA